MRASVRVCVFVCVCVCALKYNNNNKNALLVHHFGGHSKRAIKSYIVTHPESRSEPVWPSGKALGW